MTDLFGVKGREFLDEAMEKVRPAAKRVIADNLALIDHLNQQIQALEDDLELTPQIRKMVKLLKTIPGVGKISAIVIAAEIGDISRFHSAAPKGCSSSKALCNWAGLTPRVRTPKAGLRPSDRTVRHGRISKQGSSFLRGTMTQVASVASYKSKRWCPAGVLFEHHVHERLVPRCGKKGAKVAVGRRLLTVAYHMLTRNEPFPKGDTGVTRKTITSHHLLSGEPVGRMVL